MRTPDTTDFRHQIVALLPRLRRFAFALTGNQANADDLVQTACEKALRREHQWRPGTRLDSWMFRIIRNLRIDEARSLRERRPHLPLAESVVSSREKNGEIRMEARLTLDYVAGAMKRLTENDRLVLSLVCVDGRSYQEAADTLAIPVGTVMSRLARARCKLHKIVYN